MGCNSRYLIWAHAGVAATVSAKPSFFYPEEYEVSDILFFAPVNIDQFMWGQDWPYPNDGSG
jgi:hypothetical protein